MIKGIIFDLDGTLIKSIEAHKEIGNRILKKHNIELSDEEINQMNGMGEKEGYKWLRKNKKLKIITAMEIYFQKKRLRNEIIEKTTLYPKVKETLEKLNKYKLAIATSSKRNYLKKMLEKFSLEKYFEKKISKDDVKKSKPSPEIFLKAAKEIGLKPEECIIIEDSINGIKAANNANIKSVAVLSTTPKKWFEKKDSKATKTINKIGDLTENIIKEI